MATGWIASPLGECLGKRSPRQHQAHAPERRQQPKQHSPVGKRDHQTADHRREGGRDQGDAGQHRQGCRRHPRLAPVGRHRPRGHQRGGCANRLQHPPAKQEGQALCRNAGQRPGNEQQQPDQHHRPAPEPVGDRRPAELPHRQHAKVGGDQKLPILTARAEAGSHVRQRRDQHLNGERSQRRDRTEQDQLCSVQASSGQ